MIRKMPPVSVHERDATTHDYGSFVALWPELRINHTPPDRLYWERELAPHTFLLETVGGEIVSLACCFAFGKTGDVRQVVVSPAWRRRGLGFQTMHSAARRLRARGCTAWRLEVERTTVAAIRLYQRAHLRATGSIAVVRASSAVARSFSARRAANFKVTKPASSSLAALEEKFDLPTGTLPYWMTSRPDSHLLVVCQDSMPHEPVGLARWRSGRGDTDIIFPLEGSPAAVSAVLSYVVSQGCVAPLELYVGDTDAAFELINHGATKEGVLVRMAGTLPIC